VSGKAGDTLVINGENFSSLSAVTFAGKAVTFTNVKEKEFTVRVPSDLTAGKIKIEITTRGGRVSSEGFTLTQ
jgi:hypothetical protein